jgi:hypothetical protein
MTLTDLLGDILEEIQHEAERERRLWGALEDADALETVTAFLAAWHAARALPPGAHGEHWRPRLLAGIRRAGSLAGELRAAVAACEAETRDTSRVRELRPDER